MKKKWFECLEIIKEEVSEQNFNTWFKPVNVLNFKDSSIELEVPNRFIKDWLKDHYFSLLSDSLHKVTGNSCGITFVISDKENNKLPKKEQHAIKKPPSLKKSKKASNLNQKYTFENFVVGKSNEFVHAACSAVATNPSSKYNPLFIYGGVGLGKTHLLQAIGHRVLENKSDAVVCYYSSEKFMNELINSIRYEKTEAFRKKFRNMSVLLIDDIQFIAGKERTQEEFFHTFNDLYESQSQIVITSDKFPKDIQNLEERLRTRIGWGLIADIQPPDMETKVAILKKKSELEGIILPDGVAEYIASISHSNIREMEGYLIRIGAFSSLTDNEITLDMAKEVLKRVIHEENSTISIDDIQKTVAKHFKIKVSDLKSKKKLKNIAFPRQIAMYLSRNLTDASFSEIGNTFGGKDHSTIIHAYKKIEKLSKKDKTMIKSIKDLKKQLKISK